MPCARRFAFFALLCGFTAGASGFFASAWAVRPDEAIDPALQLKKLEERKQKLEAQQTKLNAHAQNAESANPDPLKAEQMAQILKDLQSIDRARVEILEQLAGSPRGVYSGLEKPENMDPSQPNTIERRPASVKPEVKENPALNSN